MESRSNKSLNRKKGAFGEDLAVKLLSKKGYEIIERNFTAKTGEIDIVARHNEYIVFVEVKLRVNLEKGSPCEAVNLKKQKKIIETAKMYIDKNELYNCDFRFDVVEILFCDDNKPMGKIIENAFLDWI